MPQFGGASDSVRLANQFRNILERLKNIESGGFRVPILDADPTPESPTNMWMLSDGRLRIRNANGTVVEYVKTASPGGSTSTTTKPTPPPVQRTHADVWVPSWAQVYAASGNPRADSSRLRYGWQDTSTQRNVSLLGFDTASIGATLTGARIVKAELYLYNLSTGRSGVASNVSIGTHSNTSAPATLAGIDTHGVGSGVYQANDGHWTPLTATVAAQLRDGTAGGVFLEGLSDSLSYAGYAAGLGSTNPPQLRVTYVK
jgi:hypothetical protein